MLQRGSSRPPGHRQAPVITTPVGRQHDSSYAKARMGSSFRWMTRRRWPTCIVRGASFPAWNQAAIADRLSVGGWSDVGRSCSSSWTSAWVNAPARRSLRQDEVNRMDDRQRLLFVSPRFLFPVDSGGKIRTTQTLPRPEGRALSASASCPPQRGAVRAAPCRAREVCDEFLWWPDSRKARRSHRASGPALNALPLPVRADWTRPRCRTRVQGVGRATGRSSLRLLHAAVLAPEELRCPSVLFTHNVETEIFAPPRSGGKECRDASAVEEPDPEMRRSSRQR